MTGNTRRPPLRRQARWVRRRAIGVLALGLAGAALLPDDAEALVRWAVASAVEAPVGAAREGDGPKRRGPANAEAGLVRVGLIEDGGLGALGAGAASPAGITAGEFARIAGHVSAGEFDRAAALAEIWRAREPDAALPYALLGLAEVGRFRTEPAARLFREALAREPGQPLASDGLATLQFRLGEPAEAARTYADALAHHPDHVTLLVRAARVDAVRGRVSAAAAKLRRAITRDPGAPAPRRRLAALYLEAGAVRRALDVALEGLAALPGDAVLARIAADARRLAAGDSE